MARVPDAHIDLVAISPEAEELAAAYIQDGAVAGSMRADAPHIALATVLRADVLVSWNFKHIVNLNRIRLFHAVNIERGYGMIEIRTPSEVLQYE